jgi:hypothetical protein
VAEKERKKRNPSPFWRDEDECDHYPVAVIMMDRNGVLIQGGAKLNTPDHFCYTLLLACRITIIFPVLTDIYYASFVKI